MEKIIAFGMTDKFKRFFELYKDSANMFQMNKWIIAIADSDSNLWGETYNGITIISPQDIKKRDYDKVVIFSNTFQNRFTERNELLKLGVICEKIDFIEHYMKLPNSKLSSCKMVYDRKEILNKLSEKENFNRICEVGVAFGGFTKELIQILDPDEFYAVDYFFQDNPYLKGVNGMFDNKDFQQSGLTLKEYYCNRYSEEIKSGKVSVYQGLSWEVLSSFQDAFFDYIYIDAAHDFESVQKDIAVAYRKVKKGGVIQFNDYGLIHAVSRKAFGVLPAVNQFIWQTKCEVIFYSLNGTGLGDLAVRVLE